MITIPQHGPEGQLYDFNLFLEQIEELRTAPTPQKRAHAGFLAIGRSGSDGIDFGYRRGYEGLWAFYPIDCDFKYMAPTVATLVQGWCSGELSV